MQITGRSAVLGLLALGATTLVLACAYLAGFWSELGEQWHSLITAERLASLPVRVSAGFTAVAVAFLFLARRLKAFAQGRRMNTVGLIVFALCVLGAMYAAAYDTFTLKDAYPFLTLFVISLLLFRFESRIVAAVLIGVIMLSFYAIGAKELGERDAKRILLNVDGQTIQQMPTS